MDTLLELQTFSERNSIRHKCLKYQTTIYHEVVKAKLELDRGYMQTLNYYKAQDDRVSWKTH
ncbi:hypothetical protein A6E11_00990 [Aliivibrio fischeri]|nr:hypothetical protein A6E09_05095 [Aliivibrio fischeri]OCH11783.1 hypothetical protein A6E11_00990 [Aliivibrio fischeri]